MTDHDDVVMVCPECGTMIELRFSATVFLDGMGRPDTGGTVGLVRASCENRHDLSAYGRHFSNEDGTRTAIGKRLRSIEDAFRRFVAQGCSSLVQL